MIETPILTKKQILEVLSIWTKIPVERLDADYALDENLLQLVDKLKSEIFGQDSAIDTVCRALKRRFILSNASHNDMRPIATLMFVGGSGTGKTELARQIADQFFASFDHMIRIDCGNYADEYSISKLLCSPPGYVGYGEGGHLTNSLRKNSFAVILFDEIEKAHPKIITDVLLQLSSNGTVTDGNTGNILDATNTIIILTSNLGTSFNRGHKNQVGFNSDTRPQDEKRGRVQSAIHSYLPNEILGRIDEIVIFNELDEDSVKAIWQKEIRKLEEKLVTGSDIGTPKIKVQIIVNELAERIFITIAMEEMSTQGARSIQRVFNRWVTDQITEMKAEKNIPMHGSYTIKIDVTENNTFTYSIVPEL